MTSGNLGGGARRFFTLLPHCGHCHVDLASIRSHLPRQRLLILISKPIRTEMQESSCCRIRVQNTEKSCLTLVGSGQERRSKMLEVYDCFYWQLRVLPRVLLARLRCPCRLCQRFSPLLLSADHHDNPELV